MDFCRTCAGMGHTREIRQGYGYGQDKEVWERCRECGGTGRKSFLIGGKATKGEDDEHEGND